MKSITLTFDNGPEPLVTPHVLDTLAKHEIKTTFFVLGHKLQTQRALSERAHAEGHWIGNHTFNHTVPLGLNEEEGISTQEIVRTAHLISDLAHHKKFFRPFGGGGHLDRRLLNEEALQLLIREKYTCVLWNVIVQDWILPDTWVERAKRLCTSQDENLLVLHDLPTGAMSHLDTFIQWAKSEGFEFKQDFPADCVPIEAGRVTQSLDMFVSKDSS